MVTLANVVKPVTVDDTAYLLYARHIAEQPADPYGFRVFWWSHPEPAMQVLCPPVVPYWLALGIRLFGDSPALLKLWLFPFVWLLAHALRAILHRFARGAEVYALPLLMLSPAVLPTVNLMLDIPAVALALAAVALFIREPRNATVTALMHAIFAGGLAALAIQAKYTALVVPVVFAWYGLTHRRLFHAAVAVGVCVGVVVSWEAFVAQAYGHSHFLFHARGAGGAPPSGAARVTEAIRGKLDLIPPLVGQLGGLAVGVGLLAGSVLRIPRRWLVAVGIAWGTGFALVCLLPHRRTVVSGEVSATTAFWQASGWCWLVTVAGCAAVLLFRVRKGLSLRLGADSWFLVGWLVLEIATTLAITPFPAARRVIGITLVAGLVAARAARRVSRAKSQRRPPRWALAAGIAAGLAVAGIDTLDAFPEKVCASQAADVVRDRPTASTVWFVGHWGFQYYCARAGMEPLVPGVSVVRAGDFLVLPVYPAAGFHRPYAGFVPVEPTRHGAVVTELMWDDWLSARTVPNFYGGANPVAGRDHPRLRVRVYQFRQNWIMPGTEQP